MDTVFKVLLISSTLVQAYAAPRSPRLTIAEYGQNYMYNHFDGNPQNTLSFGYDVADPKTGNNQYRSEERHPNGTVVGRYGYIDPYGRPVKYRYIADKLGYRVYSDVASQRPIPIVQVDEPTESSITWTRPAKPHKNQIFHDIVEQRPIPTVPVDEPMPTEPSGTWTRPVKPHNNQIFHDIVEQRPVPMVQVDEPIEPSITWTRPVKPQNNQIFHDIVQQRPIPMVQVDEPIEPSVTWARPGKPHNNQILHDIVEQLGTLISNTDFIRKV